MSFALIMPNMGKRHVGKTLVIAMGMHSAIQYADRRIITNAPLASFLYFEIKLF